ncbi:MAG: hypothetical protein WD989_01360 [Candidatus Paceibacterota bacterium]
MSKIILSLSCLVAVLALAYFKPFFWEPAPEPDNSFVLAKESKYWSERLDMLGPEKSYRELKAKFSSRSYPKQHTAAHLFGVLLYEKFGVPSISTCDEMFGFGCFHGFFTKALSVEGEKSVGKMDEECVKKFGLASQGCQHGIGHGIMEYRGRSNLAKALEDCKFTNQTRPIFGCTSGVFMEYNIPIILNDEQAQDLSITERLYNKNNPYHPCNEVKKEFLESCYFEIPQYWKQVFRKDYKTTGELCEGIKSLYYKEICFLGLGHVLAPSLNHTMAEAFDGCQKMPNREAEILCRAGSAWSFFANPQTRSDFRKLCEEGFKSEETALCIDKADLAGNHGQTFESF